MKKIYLFILLPLLAVSCHYLDISPEMGLTEEDVFSNYTNFSNYLNGCYDMGSNRTSVNNSTPKNLFYGTIPIGLDHTVSRYAMSTLTDLADCGRNRDCLKIKGGSLSGCVSTLYWAPMPIFLSNWICIRKANKCIENIGLLSGCTENDKNDLLAQAYFIRAWCHMHLCIYYGGQPYLYHSIGANESADFPRETSLETFLKCADDFQTAYELFQQCGRLRRDPVSGAGHLSNAKQAVPAGVAALAAKGRCLLYAASPLSNVNNDKSLWEKAAIANGEALKVALEQGYSLTSAEEWTSNWKGTAYTNEQIWAIHMGRFGAHEMWHVNFMPMAVSGVTHGGGEFPTQQSVDLFETIWGDPLYTDQERQEAYSMNDKGVMGPDGKLHRYYEQNPYENRDPRFYKKIVYDGSTAEGVKDKINIHYDPSSKSWPSTNLDGNTVFFGAEWNSSDTPNTSTGYCSRHHWNGHYRNVKSSMTEPVIRLAEIYLNYAEAVNMAYGPSGTASGQLSALKAVNLIRRRAGMPDVQDRFTNSAEELNKRIQNERTVEFMFEGHHYYEDERRWKIAPERMRGPLLGMYVEACATDAEHPLGRSFTRRELAASHQSTWKDAMYYFCLPEFESSKYIYYIDNEKW